jgi:hypothetical protein
MASEEDKAAAAGAAAAEGPRPPKHKGKVSQVAACPFKSPLLGI